MVDATLVESSVGKAGVSEPGSEASRITIQSALARPCRPQCLPLEAELWVFDDAGKVPAVEVRPGMELMTTAGTAVKVKRSALKPDWERDFVEVHLENGVFILTGDHLVEACRGESDWWPWLVWELEPGLLVRSHTGRSEIITVTQKPRVAVGVVEFELEFNTTVWLEARGVTVSVFGAQPEDLYRVNVVAKAFEERPPPDKARRPKSEPSRLGSQWVDVCISGEGILPSRGSAGHPDCAGACHHHASSRGCRFSAECVDCHIPGCTARRKRKKLGKRERDRRAQGKLSGGDDMLEMD